jgi:hypothetical protein
LPARNSSSATGSSTNTATLRTWWVRSTDNQATTATSPTADRYSYMLPSGIRLVAIPRSTTEPRCSTAPSTVTDTPSRPNRSAAGRTGAGPPAIAGCRATTYSSADNNAASM